MLQMSYGAIQRGFACTIASRRGLISVISFICDTQAASLNLTAKFLFEQTRHRWVANGGFQVSCAAASLPPRKVRFGPFMRKKYSVLEEVRNISLNGQRSQLTIGIQVECAAPELSLEYMTHLLAGIVLAGLDQQSRPFERAQNVR